MTRHILECPDQPKIEGNARNGSNVQQTYTIDVVTPICGGGVTPGELDPMTRVRPSSIRGHLRFWWRATRGTLYATIEELHTQESRIWGSTDTPSKVAVRVVVTAEGEREPLNEFDLDRAGKLKRDKKGKPKTRLNPDFPGYVTFPFKEDLQEGEDPTKFCATGVQFKLFLRFLSDLEVDIEAALWAWINFGGIGARTRRGCGALYCKEFSLPEGANFADWYVQNLED